MIYSLGLFLLPKGLLCFFAVTFSSGAYNAVAVFDALLFWELIIGSVNSFVGFDLANWLKYELGWSNH